MHERAIECTSRPKSALRRWSALRVAPVFVLTLHFDRLPGQFCRLLERLAGHYIEHWVAQLGGGISTRERLNGGTLHPSGPAPPSAGHRQPVLCEVIGEPIKRLA